MNAWITTQLAHERIAQAHTDAHARRLVRLLPPRQGMRLHAAVLLMRIGRAFVELGFRLSGAEDCETA